MTPEQFNALTIMIHDIAFSALKTYDLSHSPQINRDERLAAAISASQRSANAIEQARKLFVV